jgi:hypothetical protein
MKDAKDFLKKGDYIQASEKAWGRTSQIKKFFQVLILTMMYTRIILGTFEHPNYSKQNITFP